MGLGRKKKERGEKSDNKAEENHRGEAGIVKKTRVLEVKSREIVVSRRKERISRKTGDKRIEEPRKNSSE